MSKWETRSSFACGDCVDEERMEEGFRVGLELDDFILDDRDDEDYLGDAGDFDVTIWRMTGGRYRGSPRYRDRRRRSSTDVLAVMGASNRVTISKTCVRSSSWMLLTFETLYEQFRDILTPFQVSWSTSLFSCCPFFPLSCLLCACIGLKAYFGNLRLCSSSAEREQVLPGESDDLGEHAVVGFYV
jgi:hypothetical protein